MGVDEATDELGLGIGVDEAADELVALNEATPLEIDDVVDVVLLDDELDGSIVGKAEELDGVKDDVEEIIDEAEDD